MVTDDEATLYFLDTNIWIEYLKGNQKIVDKIQEVGGLEYCFLIDFVYHELQFWARISENPNENLEKVNLLFWESDVATVEDKHIMEYLQCYAEHKARLYQQNKQMDRLDLMLAVIAYPHYPIVSDRVDEFAKFGDLTIENWLE